MQVTLSKELESFIAEKVRHGGYANADVAKDPGLGRLRFQRWPELAGIRSWRVEPPYQRHLIFYRFDEELLVAE